MNKKIKIILESDFMKNLLPIVYWVWVILSFIFFSIFFIKLSHNWGESGARAILSGMSMSFLATVVLSFLCYGSFHLIVYLISYFRKTIKAVKILKKELIFEKKEKTKRTNHPKAGGLSVEED